MIITTILAGDSVVSSYSNKLMDILHVALDQGAEGHTEPSSILTAHVEDSERTSWADITTQMALARC